MLTDSPILPLSCIISINPDRPRRNTTMDPGLMLWERGADIPSRRKGREGVCPCRRPVSVAHQEDRPDRGTGC